MLALVSLLLYQLYFGDYGLPEFPGFGQLISLVCGVSLFVTFSKLAKEERPYKFALSLLATSFLVHFRPELFYLADELTLLQRFVTLGPSFQYAHNEHYLPLYWVYFYSLCALIGTKYWIGLVVSSLLHCLNAVLLIDILNQLLKRFLSDSEILSRFLGFLFVISALHAESMHWVFEHCVLLSALLILLAIRWGLHYMTTGCPKTLVSSATASMFTPLFFGNGFSVIFLLVFFCGFLFLKPQVEYRRRLCWLLSSCLLALSITGTIYIAKRKHSEGRKLSEVQLSIKGPVKYALVGSQLGATLRGLGLYPGLEFGAARKLFGYQESKPTIEFRDSVDPETLAVFAGLLVGMLLLGLLWIFFSDWRRALYYWLLSQGIILSGLMLPALARWPLGLGQSLGMRYYYLGVVGVLLLTLPLVFWAVVPPKGQKWASMLLCLHISSQLLLGGNFTYYTAMGREHRSFVQNIDSNPPIPAVFAPGLNHNQVKRILHWLRN